MTEVGISTSQNPFPRTSALGFGRGSHNRPKGFFEQLLLAQIWISPPDNWSKEAIPLEGGSKLSKAGDITS